jgi:hypothetical protein
MRIGIVVEIAPNHSGELPIDLIDASYRASHGAVIMLVLRPDLCRGVDRVLDPIVRAAGVDVKGLVYADLDDFGTVLRGTREASLVIAGSSRFRAMLAESGVGWCDVETGMNLLSTLGRPAPQRASRPAWADGQSFAAAAGA